MPEQYILDHRAAHNQCPHCGQQLDHKGPVPNLKFIGLNMRPDAAERLDEALTIAAVMSGGGRVEDDFVYIVEKFLETVTDPPVVDWAEAEKQRGLQKIKEARP